MNKYIVIALVLAVILIGGAVYKSKTDIDNCTPDMGQDRNITVHSRKLEWRFDPENITVQKCDRVKLTVINEDSFDHGVAIEAFGISQRLPANGTIDINFVATKEGQYQLYCSVSCSDSKSTGNLKDGLIQTGPYQGQFRGHLQHLGKFIVEKLTSLIQ